jgi:hypothetical protein
MAVTLNASTSTGLVQSADTSGVIELQSNGTTALTVNTNEGVQILNCLGVGNATPSTSGAGITFPASQSASTDANTLDDYEEGTFTPTIFGGTTAGTTTYSSQNGSYTKIGRMVVFVVDVEWTGQTGTGSLTLGNLPFTCGSVYGQSNYSSSNLALSANNFTSLAQINNNATTVTFYQNPTGGGALATVGIDTSARIWMTGIYFI